MRKPSAARRPATHAARLVGLGACGVGGRSRRPRRGTGHPALSGAAPPFLVATTARGRPSAPPTAPCSLPAVAARAATTESRAYQSGDRPTPALCERRIAPSVLLEVGLLDDVVELRLGEDVPHRGLLEQPADLAEPVVGVEAQVEDEGTGCVLTRLVRPRRRRPVTLHDRHDPGTVRGRLEHRPDLVVAERLFEPGRLCIGRVRRTDVALRTHSRWPRAPSQPRDGRAPPDGEARPRAGPPRDGPMAQGDSIVEARYRFNGEGQASCRKR